MSYFSSQFDVSYFPTAWLAVVRHVRNRAWALVSLIRGLLLAWTNIVLVAGLDTKGKLAKDIDVTESLWCVLLLYAAEVWYIFFHTSSPKTGTANVF